MSQGSTVKRYPVGIDSFIIVEDDTDNIVASHINDLADQIKAVETELGADPAGTEINLKNRLSVSLKDNGYLQENIIYANDLTFTASSERVRLKTTGEFGIGVTPTNLFQVGAGTSSFNGDVGIGTTIPDCPLTVNKNTVGAPDHLQSGTTLHFIQADNVASRMIFDSFNAINVFTQRRANGTAASPTSLVANDVIGNIGALGFGTASYAHANKVNIGFLAEENWTDVANGTYMYFQTTASGGTSMSEKMRITGSGKVGIGTNNPQQLFHVGVGTAIFDGKVGIGTTSPQQLFHVGAGTSRFDGNVGIGTVNSYILSATDSTPTNTVLSLTRGIQGHEIGLPTDFGNPYLRIGGREDTWGAGLYTIGFGINIGPTSYQPIEIGYSVEVAESDGYGAVVFATRSSGLSTARPTEKIRITNAGSLAIGSTSAYSKVDINLSSTQRGLMFRRSTLNTSIGYPYVGFGDRSYATNAKYTLGFGFIDNPVTGFYPAEFGFDQVYIDGYGKGDFIFALRDTLVNEAAVERVRITSAGKVGIATNNPQQLLHVGVGTSRFDGDSLLNSSSSAYQLGATTEGSWRYVRSGNLLVQQRYESSAWVDKIATTEFGGIAQKYVSSSTLVEGNIVCFAQGGTNGRVSILPISGGENEMPIGAVYAAANNNDQVWIVTSGKAYVLPESGVTAAMGYVILTSTSEAGRVIQSSTGGAVSQHWRENGHWAETGAGAGQKALANLHFN